jgi:hypothetical protein
MVDWNRRRPGKAKGLSTFSGPSPALGNQIQGGFRRDAAFGQKKETKGDDRGEAGFGRRKGVNRNAILVKKDC